MPNDKTSKNARRPRPTAINQERLEKKCKESGVRYVKPTDWSPAFKAAIEEIGGWVLFTGVGPSHTPSPENKRASDHDRTDRTLEDDEG